MLERLRNENEVVRTPVLLGNPARDVKAEERRIGQELRQPLDPLAIHIDPRYVSEPQEALVQKISCTQAMLRVRPVGTSQVCDSLVLGD
jgi:hypothetical protein